MFSRVIRAVRLCSDARICVSFKNASARSSQYQDDMGSPFVKID